MKTHPESLKLWQTEIRRAVKYLPDSEFERVQSNLFARRAQFENLRAENQSNLNFWKASPKALWEVFKEGYNSLSENVPEKRSILLGRALRRYIAALENLPDTRDNNENVSNRDIVTLTKSLFKSFGIETR